MYNIIQASPAEVQIISCACAVRTPPVRKARKSQSGRSAAGLSAVPQVSGMVCPQKPFVQAYLHQWLRMLCLAASRYVQHLRQPHLLPQLVIKLVIKLCPRSCAQA